MALSNEDKRDVARHMGKKMAHRVEKVTDDSSNRLTGYEKDKLRKKYGQNRLTGAMLDEGRRAKSQALKKKTSSADGIDKARKQQGYKPLDAKRRRIHEGMDKYLP